MSSKGQGARGTAICTVDFHRTLNAWSGVIPPKDALREAGADIDGKSLVEVDIKSALCDLRLGLLDITPAEVVGDNVVAEIENRRVGDLGPGTLDCSLWWISLDLPLAKVWADLQESQWPLGR